jgi:CheY-like chemotaxis protein
MIHENEIQAGPEPPAAARRTVLVVDAYHHSRHGLRAALIGVDCRVETAANGREAIEHMRQTRFDVAVIDFDLPPAGGVAGNAWDVARLFRALNPGAAIVMVSAERQPVSDDVARELGPCQLLEKPISPARVRAIVCAVGGDAERC